MTTDLFDEVPTPHEAPRAAGDTPSISDAAREAARHQTFFAVDHAARSSRPRIPREYGFTARTWRAWWTGGLPIPPEDEGPRHPSEWATPEEWERFPALNRDRSRWEAFGFDPRTAILWRSRGLPLPPEPVEDLGVHPG